MRIRNLLLVLVLSVLVPAFIAAGVAVWYVYKEEQAAQEKGLLETARAFALLVNNEIKTKESILRTLAYSPILAQGDLAAFYEYAKRMAPTPETTIILQELDGKQLLNTRVPLGSALPNRRSSNIGELIKRHGADHTLVSDLFFAPIAKRHEFTIQVPVKLNGEIRYFLTMGINAAQLQYLLKAQQLPEQWLGAIVDRQGVIVARSRDPQHYVGRSVRETTRQRLASEREGVYSTVTLDGIPVKAFFSHIPNSDWKFIFSIPETEIRQTAVGATKILASISIVLLVLAVAAASWVARRVIQPMEALEKAAVSLGAGDVVSYIPQNLQEVDAVGVTMLKAGAQIQRAQAELEQRVAEAVSATERAQRTLLQSQKLEAVGRLTAGIAHEFNNLLQTLSTALQLAEMTSTQSKVKSIMETGKRAVDRATALTRQLGVFGRVQDARLETIHLREHVDSFVQLVEGTLPSDIHLEVRAAKEVWPVTADPLQLELALLNITLNARDAMPEGGRLSLELSNQVFEHEVHGLPPGHYVRIAIEDTGSGMPLEVLSKALDPFFTTKEVGKGTGMGLPQAYGFATQSQGMLVLKSIEGQGTTVELFLPKAADSFSKANHSEQIKKDHASVQGEILFVEDDPLVREAVVPVLEKAGFTVYMAHTGEDALAILTSGQHFDAVFSDIVMPGRISGIDLAGIINQKFPQIKIVLATGYSDKRLDLPGVHLLAKPYEMSAAIQLLAT